MTQETNKSNQIDRALGQKLTALREAANLTPSQLAVKLDLKRQDVLALETGEQRISATRLWQICELFDIRPKDFYADIVKNQTDEPNVQTQTLHDLAARFRDKT